ncbi:MAG TPA: hypothetical protein VJK66_05655 [Gaiellaceae bacterium]|nr:hypothetical protein [Gaiellaceae bacterium]
MSSIDLAVGLTRAWVRVYTRGLPAEERTARRAELDADLWEHAHDAGNESRRQVRIALEVVERLVAGMPADISWRREAKRGWRARVEQGSRSMLSMTKKHGMIALTGALGLWYLFIAVTAPLSGDDWTGGTREMLTFGLVCGIAAILVFTGLVRLRKSKRWARTMLGIGAVMGAVFTFWIVVPVVAALAILIWLLVTRERRTPAHA